LVIDLQSKPTTAKRVRFSRLEIKFYWKPWKQETNCPGSWQWQLNLPQLKSGFEEGLAA
jgi:hypothetical protein